MRIIVERVLKEEQDARGLIATANQEAAAIVAAAKRESQNIIACAMAEAKDSANKQREDARRCFLAAKEKALQAAQDTVTALRNRRQGDILGIARKIFAQIITIEE